MQERPVGVLLQVTDTTEPVRDQKLASAINEALLISGVRQHKIAEIAVGLSVRLQRAIEASKDDTQAAQAALDLVRVNVAAGTARAYADACSSGLRIASAEHSTDLQQQALDISIRLQQAGRHGLITHCRVPVTP